MPRELNTLAIPDDYRPRKARMLASSGIDGENYESDEFPEPDYSAAPVGISNQVNLHKLEHDLNRNPLNEIASLMRALTYGEMMELAQAIWKIRPEGEDVDQDNLPMLLHRWSTSAEN